MTLWQGENVGDTMEEVSAGGTFLRRIEPVCGGGGDSLLWSEDFDLYANDSGLHGQGGWKGWDDDPAFDAPVTDVQAGSAPNSVDISANADIVHEFSGADSGKWVFTAWQYIPGDFFDPGSEPFDGSYFILLNTYNDGGPYNWSVQMLFDSNDGMLKVFHGDGSNTINVPYETDRWVEIEAIIDLDNDWTQIYYDDSLVIEYSWTGGVFGDGGGALNIAAVDLFANGSTSVYYDDLLLAAAPCSADLDLDGDGDVILNDYALFRDCLTGPGGGPVSGQCAAADSDCDDDVDLVDFAAFQLAFTDSP